jgi:hypothetical protein
MLRAHLHLDHRNPSLCSVEIYLRPMLVAKLGGRTTTTGARLKAQALTKDASVAVDGT